MYTADSRFLAGASRAVASQQNLQIQSTQAEKAIMDLSLQQNGRRVGLIFALTPEAQLLLSLLLHLLTEVGSHCDKNCMSPYSLAVCWAPNLVPDSSEPADVRLIEWLISHARLLLRVPAQWTKTLKPEVESLNTTADNTSTTSVLASSGVPIETGLYDDYEEIDLDDDDDNYREQEGQTRKREKVRRRSHHLGITLNSSPYAPRMGSNSEGAWFAHHINPTVGSEGAGNWATPAMMSSGDSSVSNSNSKIGRNCIGFPFQPSEEAFPTAAWRPLLRKMSTAPSRSSCLSADLINLRQISEAADKRWKILLANCNLPCLLLLARLRSLCQLGLTSNTLIGTADSSHTGLVADGPTPPTTWLDQLGWSAQRGSAPRTVHISRQLHAPADELASSREFRGKDAAAETEDEEEDEEDEEEQQEEVGFVDFSTYSWFSDIAFMTAMEQAKAGTPLPSTVLRRRTRSLKSDTMTPLELSTIPTETASPSSWATIPPSTSPPLGCPPAPASSALP